MRRATLDEQIARQQVRPPRHPFLSLLAFMGLLCSLGAVLTTFGLVTNSVPVATGRNASVPEATVRPVRPEGWHVRTVSGTLGTVDDPRVAAVVWQDFMEAYHWLFTSGWHPDYASTV